MFKNQKDFEKQLEDTEDQAKIAIARELWEDVQDSINELVTLATDAYDLQQHSDLVQSPGLIETIRERLEHFTKHGKTVETDAFHNNDQQLVSAAISLVLPPNNPAFLFKMPTSWKDVALWKKMTQKSFSERLIIAASLLIAEYDARQWLKAKLEAREYINEADTLEETIMGADAWEALQRQNFTEGFTPDNGRACWAKMFTMDDPMHPTVTKKGYFASNDSAFTEPRLDSTHVVWYNK